MPTKPDVFAYDAPPQPAVPVAALRGLYATWVDAYVADIDPPGLEELVKQLAALCDAAERT